VTDGAENAGAKAAKRRAGGRPFQPGQSGNPAGKPKGARNRQTLILEAMVDKAGPKLVKKAIAMALSGDASVMRALLPMLLPARRERPVEFPLPAIATAEDALLASQLILAGAANGVLTPGEAADLSKALTDHARLLELHELEGRLNAIEAERGIGAGPALQ
jgi:hypothetical protein